MLFWYELMKQQKGQKLHIDKSSEVRKTRREKRELSSCLLLFYYYFLLIDFKVSNIGVQPKMSNTLLPFIHPLQLQRKKIFFYEKNYLSRDNL